MDSEKDKSRGRGGEKKKEGGRKMPFYHVSIVLPSLNCFILRLEES